MILFLSKDFKTRLNAKRQKNGAFFVYLEKQAPAGGWYSDFLTISQAENILQLLKDFEKINKKI